jgi:hypothetical protein
MPNQDLSEAIFEAGDKTRGQGSRRSKYSPRPGSPSLFKRRSFDTFYLFCVLLLFLAIITQVVALAFYS